MPLLTFLGGSAREGDLRDLTAEEAAALTTIGDSADLCDYSHPLPAFTSTRDYADLRGYAHPLPALTTFGVDAFLTGYAHPLPALTTFGGRAFLTGYAHPLPALTRLSGRAWLSGYAHPPDWIAYAGDDGRGFSFWMDRRNGHIRAGCRDFNRHDALFHWGPRGPSNRPDCLALVMKLAREAAGHGDLFP